MRVIALAAMTADGRIARDDHDGAGWTSREDRRMFVAVTRAAGVVILGRATYELLPRPLAGRLMIVLTSHPERHTPRPGEVEFTSAPPRELLADLSARGYATAIVAGGAAIYSAFLAAGLVDEFWITIEPLIFGTGVPLVRDLAHDVRLRLFEVVRLSEDTVQMKYRIGSGD